MYLLKYILWWLLKENLLYVLTVKHLNRKLLLIFMWLLVWQSLYFFLPAYFANMAPIIFKWFPYGSSPVCEKYLGGNKTWRGLIAATLTGGFIFWVQKLLFNAGFQKLAGIDYADFPILLGFLMGLGGILGDLVKSYHKRKAGIKPGYRWFPFDQIDFVIGGLIGSFFIFVPPVEVVAVLFLATPVLHIVVNHAAYWLKIRDCKW